MSYGLLLSGANSAPRALWRIDPVTNRAIPVITTFVDAAHIHLFPSLNCFLKEK